MAQNNKFLLWLAKQSLKCELAVFVLIVLYAISKVFGVEAYVRAALLVIGVITLIALASRFAYHGDRSVKTMTDILAALGTLMVCMLLF